MKEASLKENTHTKILALKTSRAMKFLQINVTDVSQVINTQDYDILRGFLWFSFMGVY